jgi:DNA-binding response OmpR family regulator
MRNTLSAVARILIFEPQGDIRSLLEIVVARLGHDPWVFDGDGYDSLDVDAAVIDPDEGEGLSLARELRERGVPVILTSIFPAGRQALELTPAVYLVKPFALYALEAALEDAVRPARASVAHQPA